MNFTPMDPKDIWRLLEATDEKGNKIHQDILTSAANKEEVLFRNVACPVCGEHGHQPFLDPKRPFNTGALVPNRFLRCLHCEAEFDPNTLFVIRVIPARG